MYDKSIFRPKAHTIRSVIKLMLETYINGYAPGSHKKKQLFTNKY